MATISTSGSSTLFGNNQLFRTSSGIPYFITWVNNETLVFKGNSANPTSFSEVDSSNRLTTANDARGAIDSTNKIHVVQLVDGGKSSSFRHFIFDTSTDTWDSTTGEEITTIDISDLTSPYYCNIAIDSNDIPHVTIPYAYTSMGSPFSGNQYTNRVGGSWKTPIEVSTSLGYIIHIDSTNTPIISAGDNLYRGNANNATTFTGAGLASGANDLTITNLVSTSSGYFYYVTIDSSLDRIRWRSLTNFSNWTNSGSWQNTSYNLGAANWLSNSVGVIPIGDDVYVYFYNYNNGNITSAILNGTSITDPLTDTALTTSGYLGFQLAHDYYHFWDSNGTDRSQANVNLPEITFVTKQSNSTFEFETISLSSGNVTANATKLDLSITLLSPTISGDAFDTQNIQDLAVSLLTASVVISTSVTTTQNLLDYTITQETPTLELGAGAEANLIDLSISQLAPSIQLGDTIEVNTQDLAINILSATAGTSTNVSGDANLIDFTISTLQVTASGTTNVTTNQNLLDLSLNLLSPSVEFGALIEQATQDLAIALLTSAANTEVLTEQSTQDINIALLQVTAFGATNISIDQNLIDYTISTLQVNVNLGNLIETSLQDIAIATLQVTASGTTNVTTTQNLLDLNISLLSPTAGTSTNVTAQASILNLSLSLETPSLSLGLGIDTNVLNLSLNLETPSVDLESFIEVNTQDLSISLLSATANTGESIGVNTQDLLLSLLAPSLNLGTSVEVSTLNLSLSLESTNISTSTTIETNVLNLSLSLETPSVNIGNSIGANTQDLTISLETPSVSIGNLIEVNTTNLNLSLLPPLIGDSAIAVVNKLSYNISTLSPTVTTDFQAFANKIDFNIDTYLLDIYRGWTVDVNKIDTSISLYSAKVNITALANKIDFTIDLFSPSITGLALVVPNTIDQLITLIDPSLKISEVAPTQIINLDTNLLQVYPLIGDYAFVNKINLSSQLLPVAVNIHKDAPTNKISYSIALLGATANGTTVVLLKEIKFYVWTKRISVVTSSPFRLGEGFVETIDVGINLYQVEVKIDKTITTKNPNFSTIKIGHPNSNQVNAQPSEGIVFRPVAAYDIYKTWWDMSLVDPTYDSGVWSSIDNFPNAQGDTDILFIYEYQNSRFNTLYLKLPYILNRQAPHYFGFRTQNGYGNIQVRIGLRSIPNGGKPSGDFSGDEIAERIIDIPNIFTATTYEFQLTEQEIDTLQSYDPNDIYIVYRNYIYDEPPVGTHINNYITSIFLRQGVEVIVNNVPTIDISISLLQAQAGMITIVNLNKIDLTIDTQELTFIDYGVTVDVNTIDISTNILPFDYLPQSTAETNTQSLNITLLKPDFYVVAQANTIDLSIQSQEVKVKRDFSIYQPTIKINVDLKPVSVILGQYQVDTNSIDYSIDLYSVSTTGESRAIANLIDEPITLNQVQIKADCFIAAERVDLFETINSVQVTGEARVNLDTLNFGIYLKEPYFYEDAQENETFCANSIITSSISRNSQVTTNLKKSSEVDTIKKFKSIIRCK